MYATLAQHCSQIWSAGRLGGDFWSKLRLRAWGSDNQSEAGVACRLRVATPISNNTNKYRNEEIHIFYIWPCVTTVLYANLVIFQSVAMWRLYAVLSEFFWYIYFLLYIVLYLLVFPYLVLKFFWILYYFIIYIVLFRPDYRRPGDLYQRVVT